MIDPTGLVTITGGKWTTYRRMAEDAVNRRAHLANLAPRPCQTQSLPLHGAIPRDRDETSFIPYGSERPLVDAICRRETDGERLLAPSLPYRQGEVLWQARYEMARTVEDVLARRTRSLLLDAQAAIAAAPLVARLLAKELHRDEDWQKKQNDAFRSLAKGYLLASPRES